MILALLPGYLLGLTARAALGNKGQLHEWSDVDHPYTCSCKNNLPQVPIVRLHETGAKTRCALINARCLRNKTLVVRDYVDDCSADNVALTETWLGDEDNASVSELCRNTFSLAHQPPGCFGVLFRQSFQLVSRVNIDTCASEPLSVTLRNARIEYTTRVIII